MFAFHLIILAVSAFLFLTFSPFAMGLGLINLALVAKHRAKSGVYAAEVARGRGR